MLRDPSGSAAGQFFTLTDRVRAMVGDDSVSGSERGGGGGGGVHHHHEHLLHPHRPHHPGPGSLSGKDEDDDYPSSLHVRNLSRFPGATEPEELVDTEFRWSHGGSTVQLAGSFNNWEQRIPMVPDTTSPNLQSGGVQDFVVILRLPPGLHHLKFIVDEEWMLSPDLPTIQSPTDGVIHNVIEVKRRVFEEAPNFTDSDDDDDMTGSAGETEEEYRGLFESSSGLTGDPGGLQRSEKRRRMSRGPQYGQVIPPEEDYDYGKDPPRLPPHLHPAHLETAVDSTEQSGNPYLLPLPRHVILNHLYIYAGASTSSTAFVSAITQRFKTRSFVSAAPKYVTVIFYAPRENVGPRAHPHPASVDLEESDDDDDADDDEDYHGPDDDDDDDEDYEGAEDQDFQDSFFGEPDDLDLGSLGMYSGRH